MTFRKWADFDSVLDQCAATEGNTFFTRYTHHNEPNSLQVKYRFKHFMLIGFQV